MSVDICTRLRTPHTYSSDYLEGVLVTKCALLCRHNDAGQYWVKMGGRGATLASNNTAFTQNACSTLVSKVREPSRLFQESALKSATQSAHIQPA
eukprot:406814-Rhodomonas_salina.2